MPDVWRCVSHVRELIRPDSCAGSGLPPGSIASIQIVLRSADGFTRGGRKHSSVMGTPRASSEPGAVSPGLHSRTFGQARPTCLDVCHRRCRPGRSPACFSVSSSPSKLQERRFPETSGSGCAWVCCGTGGRRPTLVGDPDARSSLHTQPSDRGGPPGRDRRAVSMPAASVVYGRDPDVRRCRSRAADRPPQR
jgi:hypothetical protein